MQKRSGAYGLEEAFRFRNISTGLYLSQDPISERLKLTSDGNREECYFWLYPKNKHNEEQGYIEYKDMLRIQTSNGSYLQQPEGINDLEDLCGPKRIEVAKHLFYIEQSPKEISETAVKLYSLEKYFLNFHQFLQNWGISTQSSMLNKEDISVYDYTKALESDRDLFNEADSLREKLEALEDFLKNPNRNYLSLKHKQFLLTEQKIVEILLLIAELIDSKVYGIRKKEDNKEDRKHYKHQQTLIGDEKWESRAKTPQYIARKYLNSISKQIYDILRTTISHNMDVSSIVLKYSVFLSRQLVHYKNEIGPLLKTAIQNSIHIKDIDPHCEQVVQWVGLLEMIIEVENNIELQTLYLNLISHTCLGACKTGDPGHQNKVLQEFFSPNSNFLKGLIAFLKRNGKIYISFAMRDGMLKEEFLTMNPSLAGNGIGHEEQNMKYYFSLLDLSRANTPGVELIVDYLASVLWLFYCLCKNRNEEGIEHIKGTGLNPDVLMNCMHDSSIHIKLRRAFILLYDVLFIDVSPYKSIKDCTNHCHIWEEIDKKKLSDYTYVWHNLSNQNTLDRMKYYHKEKVKAINDFILDFWVHGKGIVKKDEDYTFISENKYLRKAGLIHAVLGFTRNAINLGFTNAEINNRVLISIISLFAAYCKDQWYENPLEEQSESWIFVFMRSHSLSTKHEIFNQIYCETLEILHIIAGLRLSLQVAGFLKVFKLCFDNGVSLDRDSFNHVFSFFFRKYSLNIPIFQDEDSYLEPDYKQLLPQHIKSIIPNEAVHNQLREIVVEAGNTESKEVVKGGLVLLNMLFKISHKGKNIEKLARKVLKDYFIQRESLLRDLQRIEIISGKEEIEIYFEFDSPERLEEQIVKVLQDDRNLRQNYKIDSVNIFL